MPCGKCGFGAASVIVNVVGSTTSEFVTWAACLIAVEPRAGSRKRSQLNLTAEASSGVPSVNVRPGCRVSVNVVPPSAVEKSVAILYSISNVSRLLIINVPYSVTDDRLMRESIGQRRRSRDRGSAGCRTSAVPPATGSPSSAPTEVWLPVSVPEAPHALRRSAPAQAVAVRNCLDRNIVDLSVFRQ